MTSAPQTLILGLTCYDKKGRKKAVDVHIFPWMETQGTAYTLESVVRHQGNSVRSWHYTVCLSPPETSSAWAHVSDDRNGRRTCGRLCDVRKIAMAMWTRPTSHATGGRTHWSRCSRETTARQTAATTIAMLGTRMTRACLLLRQGAGPRSARAPSWCGVQQGFFIKDEMRKEGVGQTDCRDEEERRPARPVELPVLPVHMLQRPSHIEQFAAAPVAPTRQEGFPVPELRGSHEVSL